MIGYMGHKAVYRHPLKKVVAPPEPDFSNLNNEAYQQSLVE